MTRGPMPGDHRHFAWGRMRDMDGEIFSAHINVEDRMKGIEFLKTLRL